MLVQGIIPTADILSTAMEEVFPRNLENGRKETPSHNLVLHEFAHQLDMLNGRITDGTPPLQSEADNDRWESVLGPEFDHLVEDCRRGHHGFIDCYGATNPAEFFAVITEAFFERLNALRLHHAEAYNVLRDYYGLDPAEWPGSVLVD